MSNFDAIKTLLESPQVNNIIILPHNFPDGDTLGSAIGIKVLLNQFNKEGHIVLNDDIPSNLLFLFEDLGACVKKEDLPFEKIDLAIAVDCGETKLFEDRLFIFDKADKTLSIDHHITNSKYAQINWIDHKASSTGEIVADLFVSLNKPFTKSGARGLYAAIVTDTGSFRYSNTSPKTLAMASKLLAENFDFNRLNVELFQNKSLEKVTLLNQVFSTLTLYHEDKCALVTLTWEMIQRLNLAEYDTDGIVEFVRDIAGVEVVVFIRSISESAYKVSMRSKNDFDVSAIAIKFGGGGHIKAAGFKSTKPIEKLKDELICAIEEAL